MQEEYGRGGREVGIARSRWIDRYIDIARLVWHWDERTGADFGISILLAFRSRKRRENVHFMSFAKSQWIFVILFVLHRLAAWQDICGWKNQGLSADISCSHERSDDLQGVKWGSSYLAQTPGMALKIQCFFKLKSGWAFQEQSMNCFLHFVGFNPAQWTPTIVLCTQGVEEQ